MCLCKKLSRTFKTWTSEGATKPAKILQPLNKGLETEESSTEDEEPNLGDAPPEVSDWDLPNNHRKSQELEPLNHPPPKNTNPRCHHKHPRKVASLSMNSPKWEEQVGWAASVYDRGVKELRGVAENILRGCLEEHTTLRWPGEAKEKIRQLEVLEKIPERGVYTAGSRINGQTAAATIRKASFLGWYATVMDAELLAIAMGWELGTTVITDSQAAIGRIQNLQMEQPKG